MPSSGIKQRRGQLDVAGIKGDRKITQQPDGHSRPIHERGRERKRRKPKRGKGQQ